MVKVPLVDSTFYQSNALGLSGEREGHYPLTMRWERDGQGRVKVWTDLRLEEARNDTAWRKVALLVESPAYSETAYKTIVEMEDVFDIVLTHNKRLLDRGSPYLFYPLGGSRLLDWGMFEKSEMVSVIVGKKCDKEGQALRHQVAEWFPEIDPYGEPYTEYMDSKAPALQPYRYSVVLENIREDYYFSEKLIDAISQGCCPIYWGCPSIGDFFDEQGIISFETMDDLAEILQTVSVADYERRLDAMRCNLEIAQGYRCAEDWITKSYPWLFQ